MDKELERILGEAREEMKQHLRSWVVVVVSPMGVELVKTANDDAERIRQRITPDIRDIHDKMLEMF